MADPDMFQQIIVNLVVNARDAMSSGGQLTIRASEISFSSADLAGNSERKEGRFVRLSVTDTGQGMDTAVINRLFEPFFTTKDVGKGSGLGLATVSGMVNQHHGWIEVESKLGHGTTFDLYFPVTDKTPEIPAAESGEPLRGGQETILVCEDEEVLRELVREILTSHGYRILESANGMQALHHWEQHRGGIDLLLTDISLPDDMSGRDLAARLRAENPQLPVIFSSGFTLETESPDQVNPRNFSLSKPYRPAQLAQTVRQALDASLKQPPLAAPAS
jgi:CheY-like chemotaxis protein